MVEQACLGIPLSRAFERMSTKPTIEIDLSSKLDQIVELYAPPLDELLAILSDDIKDFFKDTTVEIVECPDFTSSPFNMTGQGIGPNLRIAEIGGVGNLFPSLRREKVFNMSKVVETCGLTNCFVFGLGAGPRRAVGSNCEMVADAVFSDSSLKVNTHTCKIVGDTYKQEETSDLGFTLMANLAICTNKTNEPVLKITARKRIDDINFPEAIRQILFKHYNAKLVSMCGIFLIKRGKAMVHVMPDLPTEDFYSRDELKNRWLQYFEVSAPLVCATVLHTLDPNLDLRLQHTHVFSQHGDAGHYHYDTTPDIVEYTGYFKPAEKLYRIDQINTLGWEADIL